MLTTASAMRIGRRRWGSRPSPGRKHSGAVLFAAAPHCCVVRCVVDIVVIVAAAVVALVSDLLLGIARIQLAD